MKKFKLFIKFDREEKWLNEMARSGNELVSKNALGIYSFCKAQPMDSQIRIDYRLFKRNEDFQDYRQLFEDSGWRHITGNKSSGSQYFVRSDSNASNDIFSDKASKSGRYKRLSDYNLLMFAVFIPMMIVCFNNDWIDIEAMLNPRLLYYTPGLWEKIGFDFWSSFLFETPFALMRGFLWLVFPVTLLTFLYFAVRSYFLGKD